MQKLIEALKRETDILIVVAVAAAFRLKDIVTDDLWYDEAFTGVLMKLPYRQFLDAALEDAHPPLYYYISRVWTMLIGTNDFTLRLLPLVFGLGTVYVVYLVGKHLFNKEAGVISAVLIAVSPFFVGYSIEARSYSLYGFITILTFYFLIRRSLLPFVAGLILMLFTHYMAVAFIGVFLLIFVWQRKQDLKVLAKESLLLIPFGLLVLYQIQKMLAQAETGLNSGWMRESSLINIPRSLIAYLFGIKVRLPGADDINNLQFIFNEYIWGGILLAGFFGLLIYALYKFYKTDRDKFINVLYLVLGFVLPQLMLIAYGLYKDQSLYVERYLFPASIFFMLSVGAILNKLFSFEVSAIVVVLYILLSLNIVPQEYYVGMKTLAKELGDERVEVIFTSPLDYTVARYYFGLDNERVKLQEPQNPQESFEWWPLIDRSARPENTETAIYVSADDGRMQNDFTKLQTQEDFGNYMLYQLKPGTDFSTDPSQ